MITTCILTKNSEAFIRRALHCASSCDEIVVIDNGSTDSTIDIVKNYTDNYHIIPTDGPPNFAYLRNSGAWKGHNDLVLMLDADEFINPELYKMMEQHTHKLSGGICLFPLCESYAPGYCDPKFLREPKARLYDRRHSIWAGEIHEHLIGPGWNNTIELPFFLWHRAFKYSWDTLWNKILFYNKTMGRKDPKFSNEDYWKTEYQRMYEAQVEVSLDVEKNFCMELYQRLQWQTVDVVSNI